MSAVTKLSYREVLELPPLERRRLLYKAQATKLEPMPCKGCGEEIQPAPDVERCLNCGHAAPHICGFCGEFFWARSGAEYCPKKCCRQRKKEYKEADKLPPAFFSPEEPSRRRELGVPAGEPASGEIWVVCPSRGLVYQGPDIRPRPWKQDDALDIVRRVPVGDFVLKEEARTQKPRRRGPRKSSELKVIKGGNVEVFKSSAVFTRKQRAA